MGKIGDKETLLRVASDWGSFPINTLQQAENFLHRLYSATDGWVILDFLDASNWDHFETFSVASNKGLLQINWHDFIEQDREHHRSEQREMMAMAFPASLYGVAMRFQSIDRLGDDEMCFFALRGYALTDKEIRKCFEAKSQEFILRDDRPFSREVLRRINGHVENIACITSAIYTILIVPKKTGFSVFGSKFLLYRHNLLLIDESLARCETELQTIDASDIEAICEKANTVRRNMENLLKIECCFREIEIKKPYSQARLGNLWGPLKAFHTDDTRTKLSKFIQRANELSHDSGVPVNKKHAEMLAPVARDYCKSLASEIWEECLHPTIRRSSNGYVAF